MEGQFKFLLVEDNIDSKEIIQELKMVKTRLLLLVDTCHSGAILTDWKPNNNVSIITACKADEAAYVWNFVVPFVDSLKVADYNDDGLISISEVERYIKQNVNSKQTPMTLGRMDFALCETESKFLVFYNETRIKALNFFREMFDFNESRKKQQRIVSSLIGLP